VDSVAASKAFDRDICCVFEAYNQLPFGSQYVHL